MKFDRLERQSFFESSIQFSVSFVSICVLHDRGSLQLLESRSDFNWISASKIQPLFSQMLQRI